MKILISLQILFIISFSGNCQKANTIIPANIQVGDNISVLQIHDLHSNSNNTNTIGGFKGRWVVLDFWNRYCGACIANFKRLNEIQTEFRDKLEIILVGFNSNMYNSDEDKLVKEAYQRYKTLWHLKLAYSFDSTLIKKFNVTSFPSTAIIDTFGNLTLNQHGLSLNSITDIMTGANKSIENNYITARSKRTPFNFNNLFLKNNNGGDDSIILSRSIIAKWIPKMSFFFGTEVYFDYKLYHGKIQLLGENLEQLYRTSFTGQFTFHYGDPFYGKFWPNLILKIPDSANFKPNYYTGEGVYCYSLYINDSTLSRDSILKRIQVDLKSQFGYRVRIVNRRMPCLKVFSTPSARKRLASKDSVFSIYALPHATFFGRYITMETVLKEIAANNSTKLPIIDRTKISKHIDIEVDAVLTDLPDLKKALKKSGLTIRKSTIKMKVIEVSN